MGLIGTLLVVLISNLTLGPLSNQVSPTTSNNDGPGGVSFFETNTGIRLAPKLRSAQQSSRYDAVIIDVENLRGRSGFSFSHAQVLESLKIWNVLHTHGRLTLAIDHGNEASSFYIPDAGYSIVFAGPVCKADDTIARDLIPFFANTLSLDKIQVVTADFELMGRCRRSSSSSQVDILSPQAVLKDLEEILEAYPLDQALNGEDGNAHDTITPDDPSGLVDSYSLKLGAELLEIEALLRCRSGMNSKRRKKLRLKGQTLWQKLETISPSMLERVKSVIKEGKNCASVRELSKSEQNAFLARWEKEQRSQRRKETTQDRIVLAENLRQQLLREICVASVFDDSNITDDGVPSAIAFVHYRSQIAKETSYALQPTPSMMTSSNIATLSKQGNALRLVVISDTHGFEDQLTIDRRALPAGDVLLHLGDFAADGGLDKADKLSKFDGWLASAAAHIPIKIVLRGNHDPRYYNFALSEAKYITEATVHKIAGYNFAFVPFLSGGMRRKKNLPKSCDVLVTHVPPHTILDRCVTGKHAGSKSLLKGAQQMTAGPPFLWLCGHIHESRGVVRNSVFCLNQVTTVVNAACANPGIAKCLKYGEAVLTIGSSDLPKSTAATKRLVNIISMEGQFVFSERGHSFFQKKNESARQMLLAVDLGLRTGLSLFDDVGRLHRCDHFQLDSPADLEEWASTLLEQWEADANNDATLPNLEDSHSDEILWKVTHIAIEGEDPALAKAWRLAANDERSIIFVKPEEWRNDLLSIEEKRNGASSKSASQRIAKEIVKQYGILSEKWQPNNDLLQADMAESVLLGLHVSRRLGWGEIRDPVIGKSGD